MKNLWSVTKLNIFLIPIFFVSQIGVAQGYRELQVGDTLADIKLSSILNNNLSIAKLSDFKQKLLILDFWATWCSPCIAAFKKNDSIQKFYGQRIGFLPITYEEENHVKSFLKKFSKIGGLFPLTVTNDTLLSKIFKHSSLPHYVWLNENRRVIAITQGEDVDKDNISEYLSSGKFKYTLKDDGDRVLLKTPAFPVSIQVVKGSDIELEKLSDSTLLMHSVLTNFVEGLSSGATFHDSTQILVRNTTIAYLYKVALFGNGVNLINTSNIKVEIVDPELYMKILGVKIDGTKLHSGMETLAWQRENAYCYESKVPPTSVKEKFNIFLQELNAYFGVKYGIIGLKEKQKRKCLALIRTSLDSRLTTKGGEPLIQYDHFSMKARNVDMNAIKDRLAFPLQSYPPIVNKTNFTTNIDLEINCNLSDLHELNKELNRYGLKLEESEEIIETAVIKLK